jgi:DHA1 family bicyclomycin/chloramphenicol resistance-like MFS transporter
MQHVENAKPVRLTAGIGALVLLVILPMLATDIYLPSLPQVEGELNASHAAVMLTLTAYMIGYALSLILSGLASDRYGRRIVIMVGISMYCISSLACAVSSSIESLVIFRFLQALGGGCGTLLARVVVRDMYDQQNQVRVLSYLSAGLALSPTLGPIIGGYLAVALGWRSPFVFLAAFSCVAWVMTLLLLNETHPAEKRHPVTLPAILKLYSELLRHRAFISYTLIISLAWSVYFSFLASSSFILQKIFGLSPIAYGVIFALTISGYIVGTIVTRKQIGRRSIDGMIKGASMVMLMATSLLALSTFLGGQNLTVMMVLIAVALAGVGVIFPTTQAAVMRPFPSNVGLVAGMFYAMEMFFGALTSLILGHVSSTTSALSMTVVMFGAALLMFLVVRFLIDASGTGVPQQLTPASLSSPGLAKETE